MGEPAQTQTVNVDLTPAELWAVYDAVTIRLNELAPPPPGAVQPFGKEAIATTSTFSLQLPDPVRQTLISARDSCRAVLGGERAHL